MGKQQHDQWLKTHLAGKYRQPDQVRKDVLNAIAHYKDLRPQAEQFIYNDGSRKNLVNLSGTIPVMYKGKTYNIPVAIWLQEPHPYAPPLCFVKPTSTMQVKQGRHVDTNGRVYLPYLNEWKANTHNLIGCIQVMTAIFGEEPPVYSKHTTPAPAQVTPYPTPSVSQPPYPGYPPVQGPPSTNYQPNFNTPYPPINQPTPYPMTTQSPMVTSSSAYPPYPAYPQANQMAMPPATPYPASTQPSSAQTKQQSAVDDSTIRASMLSAANDKLKRRLKDTLTLADVEMQQLRQTEGELRSGQEKLDSILQRLETEITDAESNAILLHSKNEELERELQRLDKQDQFNADEAVMATTPIYRQIVSSFAEEQALEDTIYYLGEALHKNVVDIDTFLKHVRALSRQQFILRAIIQKARKSAGLASVY